MKTRNSAYSAIALILIVLVASCNVNNNLHSDGFVAISDDGKEFMLRGKPYRFVGTNFWYGAILASDTPYGNRERLNEELDSMQTVGIDNLRILVGGDGATPLPGHIEPTLQTAPSVYDSQLLEGLDYLLAELERRDMRAVLYLNNTWEWSGGFGTYLEWAGHGPAPLPSIDGYDKFTRHVSRFVTDSTAKSLFDNHIQNIVGRRNSITGQPYSESTAIMSWQIANEPRFFDPENADEFVKWIEHCGQLIKSIDSNHLVSTGNEGSKGCSEDIRVWADIHNSEAIDYATIHIWPYNWSWVKADSLSALLPSAIDSALNYISRHRELTVKPIVAEEFGFPRDSMLCVPGTATTLRNRFYQAIMSQLVDRRIINGLNFWGWGGTRDPVHATWLPGDPYCGDPAQEPQGLNSVFTADRPTLKLIKNANKKLKQ